VTQTDRRGGPTLLVQRCAGVPARCSAVVELGFTDRAGLRSAAREAWEAAKAGDLRYPPTVLRGAPGAPVRPFCETCRSPWLWGGVGLAVAAGVVALIVTAGSPPPPIIGVDPNAFGRR
jgi:hypothetical protein